MAIFAPTHVWAQDLIERHQKDTIHKELMEQLLLQKPNIPSEYTMKAGIIRYKGKVVVGNDPELRNQLPITLHSSPVGVHSIMRATYHRVKSIFHWTGLKTEVEILL